MSKTVYILSAVRTPMGSFLGGLSSISATKLGSIAIKAAVERSGVSVDHIDEVFMGNVLQAGVGQAPARQAALGAGLGQNVPCTTVNKVCASGMKSIMLGAQSILAGDNHVVVVGGMESMSQTPHYVSGRNGTKFGNITMLDGITKDGLLDVYSNVPMGNCAELCAKEHNISREDQDAFAIESYRRAAAAWEAGKFNDEIVAVPVPQRKGDPIMISKDEEYTNVFLDKIPSLRPAFDKDGTITAANASTINDGASALVLVSKEVVEKYGLKPIAKIRGYCIGGGLEMALMSDIRYATPDSKFGAGEIKLGWHGGAGNTQLLPRVMSPGRALEMLLTGDIVSAAEAQDWGLVDRIFDDADIDAKVADLAARIAGNAPIASELAKHLVRVSMSTAVDVGLQYENDTFAYCFTTEDSDEGRAAFAEKRRPTRCFEPLRRNRSKRI